MIGALIPCRTGSKGIPNKNFKPFLDKPLFRWTLEAAIKSLLFDKIILSSNGGFQNLEPSGNLIVDNERPPELSDDKASLDDVLNHYANVYPEVKVWVLLQVTSPLRTGKDIRKAYELMQKKQFDSVVSVTPGTCMYWVKNAVEVHGKPAHIATYHIHKRPNRQEREKEWFLENGAIYVTPRYILEYTGCRLGGQIGLYVMPKNKSIEIDDSIDWKCAEMIARNGHGLV